MYKFTKEEESQILEQALICEGDLLVQKSWDLIYRVVEIKLKRYRFPYNVQDIEDFRGDIFIHLMKNCYQRIQKFNSQKGSLKNWLILLSRNYIVDKLKKKSDVYRLSGYGSRTELSDQIKDSISDNTEIDTTMEQILNVEQVHEYIKELNPRYQLVLVLTFFDCLPSAQIARLLNVTIDNYYVILNRAKTKLKKLFKKSMPEILEQYK